MSRNSEPKGTAIPSGSRRDKKVLNASWGLFVFSIFSILLNNLTILFMSKILTLIIFCAFLLNGCTIEKKRYSSGYHTSWHSSKNREEKSDIIQSNYDNFYPLVSFKEIEKNNLKETTVINSSSNTSAKKNKSPKKKHAIRKLQNTELDSIPKDSINSATTENIQRSELAEKFLNDEKKLSFWQLVFGLSSTAGAAGISIFYYLENVLSSLLIVGGGLGMLVSIILVFIFLARRSNIKHEYRQALRRSSIGGQANNLENLNKEIKKLTIQKVLFGLGILTIVIPPFLIGIASLILFITKSKQRKRLIVERKQMTGKFVANDITEQNVQLPKDSASLKELQMVNTNRRIRRNALFATAMFFVSIIAYLIDVTDVGSFGFLIYPFPLTLLGIFLLTLIILVIKKKILSNQIQKKRGKS